MSYTPEDRIREEQVRRLSADEDPRGSQHRDYSYTVVAKSCSLTLRSTAGVREEPAWLHPMASHLRDSFGRGVPL